MKKIERLTPEQEALLIQRRAEWFAVGSSTEPADRPRAERAITSMYAEIGQPAPRFLWCESPATSCLAVAMLRRKEVPASLGDSLRASLWDSLWDSLRDSLWDSLRASLRDSLWDSLRDSLWDSLGDSLWDSLGDSLRASLRDSLRASLRDSLWDSLWASLRASLGDSLRASLRASLRDQWHWGGHEAAWVAFYRFGGEVGVQYNPDALRKLMQHEELMRSAGWVWPYVGLCIVTERPELVCWDDAPRPRIHSADGPAVRYRDGWEVYAWHGMRVPPEIITEPVTVKRIRKEQNAEHRRVFLQRYGLGEYIRESKAKKLKADRWGALYEIPGLTSREPPIRVVLVENSTPEPDGSRKPYALAVPPECETPEQGLLAIHGLPTTARYAPVAEA